MSGSLKVFQMAVGKFACVENVEKVSGRMKRQLRKCSDKGVMCEFWLI